MTDAAAPVTVVVPAYRGAEDVRRCLDSVLRHAPATTTPFRILAIDDCSPEPEVTAVLAALAERDHPVPLLVERNEENLGFVRTVDRGLRQAPGDVVLLNADCVVTAGWLDRLADAARSRPDVASVTPLTGSGSLCTLPATVAERFGLHGPTPDVDGCAELVAAASLRIRPEVIAGVGFCMYLTRTALDATGGLDLESFGAGYGEEVDWCLRAGRLGFVHLVEDATFVHHRGAGSFGAEREDRTAVAAGVLRERYRFFRPANRQERSHDPLAAPFAAVDLALAPRRRDRPHVLQVLHAPSAYGGTEKHLEALMEALADTHDFSVLHPVDSGFLLTTRWHAPDGPVARELLLPGGSTRVHRSWDEVAGAALQLAVDLEPVDAVHVHNLIGHSLAPLGVLATLDVPVVCSVHDLYLACPHHWLLYRNQSACGIPDDRATCERCLAEVMDRPIGFLDEFRRLAGLAVDVVDDWVFPTRSAADHLLRVHDLPEDRLHIIEHGSLIPVDGRRHDPDEDLVRHAPLRVAFPGRGWRKKGLHVANAVADALADDGIEVHHLGELREAASEHLVTHGPYRNEELPALLDEIGAQVVLLPGPYAETFGQVMTEALVAGRPVIGARYGALGERITASGAGWTFDPEDPGEAVALLRRLDRCRAEVLRATRCATTTPVPTMADVVDRYADLYDRADRPAPTTRIGGRGDR